MSIYATHSLTLYLFLSLLVGRVAGATSSKEDSATTIKELREELQQQKESFAAWQVEYESLSTACAALRKEHESFVTAYAALQQDYDVLQQDYAALQDQHDDLLNESEILQSQEAQSKQELEELEEELKREREEYVRAKKHQLMESRDVESIRKSLTSGMADLDHLTVEHKSLAEQSAEKDARIDQLEKEKRRLVSIERQQSDIIDQQEGRIKQLTTDIAQLTDRIEELTQQRELDDLTIGAIEAEHFELAVACEEKERQIQKLSTPLPSDDEDAPGPSRDRRGSVAQKTIGWSDELDWSQLGLAQDSEESAGSSRSSLFTLDYGDPFDVHIDSKHDRDQSQIAQYDSTHFLPDDEKEERPDEGGGKLSDDHLQDRPDPCKNENDDIQKLMLLVAALESEKKELGDTKVKLEKQLEAYKKEKDRTSTSIEQQEVFTGIGLMGGMALFLSGGGAGVLFTLLIYYVTTEEELYDEVEEDHLEKCTPLSSLPTKNV